MLTCVQVQRQQSGVYICEASNRFWNGVTTASSKSFQLIVQYPPTLYVPAEHVCKEEDNVSVSCNVRHAHPSDVEMWWLLKDGKTVPGAHLFMGRVSRLDSGNYTCTGANTFYDGDRGHGKNTTILDVQYKPEIYLQQSQIRVKEQASVTLACTVDSNPISEDHNWTFNGQVISSELIHTIDRANRSDAGVYNFTAFNTFYDGEGGLDLT
ncbi:cell adhesion molecule CEACAM1-like [Ptychodera flava]|uniref:cell adhesion molecule CEACAM1-like n=1 Tax=Ptychodera flava TaxID=63121 RepID=UPI003969F55A